MAKQYTFPESDSVMVNEDIMAYPQGVTIPINLPTTGNYSVEYLKKELTEFAMKLLHNSMLTHKESHINWHEIAITDKVSSMSLGPSALSSDTRTDKELLSEALEEKYK